MSKIKYNIITEKGTVQAWSGVFDNEKQANKWYKEYGKEWEAKGKKLIRVICD